MRCHGRQAAVAYPVQRVRHQLDADPPAWASPTCFPVERVEAALQAEQVHCRDCLYTPLLTLWVLLAQALSPDGSCRAAASRPLACRAARDEASDEAGDTTLPVETGPYCKARQRLPETLTVREVRVRVTARGFRVKVLALVTTLLDAELYGHDMMRSPGRCAAAGTWRREAKPSRWTRGRSGKRWG